MEMEILELPDSETTCTMCYAEFLDPDDLEMHISRVHGGETQPTLIQCQFCPEHKSDLHNYALHIRDEHLPHFTCCKYCNRIFEDYDKFRKHESKHYTYVPKSMFACSQCKKLYSNVLELELHERKEHLDVVDGVFLTGCLPHLSSLLNIKALKFLHSLNEDVTYTCVMCTLSTENVRDYIDHLKTQNCQSIACDNCSSVHKSRKNLIQHFKSHRECFHNSQPKYKQCLECYKMFDSKLWPLHTKSCKPIKCRICNTIYSSLTDLANHQNELHPATVVLETCKYCQREFAGKSALGKHMERAHSDLHLYKYKCVDCNAIFKHPKKLFGHFSSTHKDLEPYTCKICDKKFKFRKKFTIHIKLDHKSIGYIEFDENYHVFFTDKKLTKILPTEANSSSVVQTSVRNESLGNVKDNSQGKKVDNDESRQKTVNVKEETTVKHDDKSQAIQNGVEKQVRFDSMKENDKGTLHSDFNTATETEGNQTEADDDTKVKKKLRKRQRPKSNAEYIVLDSSDDEPLLELQKRAKRTKRALLRNATMNRKKVSNLSNNKKRFICNICKKYCYTFQNYHNHYSSHYKNSTLKCVKCSKTFNSKHDLNKHCSEEHLSSQLTQTLKSLLEKRKKRENTEATSTEKFQKTIKSVDFESDAAKVTVTIANSSQSVKNFIESFTPEDGPKHDQPVIKNSVTIKPFTGPKKQPMIKMKKCNLNVTESSVTSLRMPVPFQQSDTETYKVTIKQVVNEPCHDDRHMTDTYDGDDYARSEPIPEVAEEVMLEETQEPPPKTLYIPHKIVLPKLPKEFNKVHIAHLQSEAPYYKIVKVADVLNPQERSNSKNQAATPKQDIKLPDGTKLVTVNPLAHLLGNTPVETILAKQKSKYYKPKAKDFEMAIAKAMLKLENPNVFPKKKRKKIDTEK